MEGGGAIMMGPIPRLPDSEPPFFRMIKKAPALLCAIVLAAIAGVPQSLADTAGAGRQSFAGSIRELGSVPGAAASRPQVTRIALSDAERGATMTFEVALRMRDLAGLQARVAAGEILTPAQMQQQYAPLAADYERVRQWLLAQGLTITRTDDNNLAIFGQGSVDAVSQAFQTTFARVVSKGKEYTSAVTAPSLPADIAPVVLGIHGLQPHIRPHPLSNLRPVQANLGGSGTPGYLPSQIATVYNANGLGVTGSGQTIALYELAFPSNADLGTFWSVAGITHSLTTVQMINVAGGPAASPSTENAEESTLDAEWASALAPGAKIRIYAANENDPAGNDEILQQVYADLPTNPGMHQMAICIGSDELEIDSDYLIIEAQYMANLASAGVTVFVASGDDGSSPGGTLQVTTPTSDPSVTGVGGTTLSLGLSGQFISESAWIDGGGGVSAVFSRPSWQKGYGVPSGAMRLVPDVAAAADPNEGGFVVFQGQQTSVGGTSWAAPIWSGFCALINQARVTAGKPVLGFFNTRLYSLLSTNAVRDIIGGSNGQYSAAPGYDLCTGIGVPNVANIITASLDPSSGPSITSTLGNVTTVAGQPATFFVTAAGASTLTYQWQRMPNGSASWTTLTDGGGYSGSTTPMLVVGAATTAMTGDQYQCVVSNGSGSATSAPESLTVNTYGVTTLAGWPESSGSADGTGWAARFAYPGSCRVDSSGNVFVADSYNNTVRKVTAAGVVTTVAGIAGQSGSTDGPVASALFNATSGVAFDTQGNLYVADDGNYVIRKVSTSGVVSTLAGAAGTSGHVDGTGTGAEFTDPQNVAFDPTSGNLFVADGKGNTIRMVTLAGVVSTLAGSGTAGSADGTGAAAQFNFPTGVAVDGSGNVYVGDTTNDTVRKITPAGVVTTIAGVAGQAGGGEGAGAKLNLPAGLTVDGYGNVFVADSGSYTVREVGVSNSVYTVAGQAGKAENVDGLPTQAKFSQIGDITVDASGVLYVSDIFNSTLRRVVPGAPPAPQFITEPQGQVVAAGSSVTLTTQISGTGPITYQWSLNGAAIAGATGPSYTIPSFGSANVGAYEVAVTTPGGTITSSAANLSGAASPVFTQQPSGQTVAEGSTVVFSALASGGPAYQWSLNGAPLTDGTSGSTTISGSAGPTLVITASTEANAGSYTCAASSASGTTTSSTAALQVVASANPGRLTDISCRAPVGTGGGVLITGFVIGGQGSSGTEPVLVRASGPALTQFGVSGVLADPQLQLFLSNSDGTSTLIASNSGWNGNPTVAATAAAVGAFAWTDNSSKDSALVETLSNGPYTAQISGASGDAGVALAEVYDATAAANYSSASPRLVNISARVGVGTGANVLIAGFVVGGATSKTVLIRASGPALANFGVSGTLADPELQLYQSNASGAPTLLATNTGWAANAQIAGEAASVGAFSWGSTATADSAILATLAPGAYTAQVSGASGDTGIALIEVYDVP